MSSPGGSSDSSGSDRGGSDSDRFWWDVPDYCDKECIKTRWRDRFRTTTDTVTSEYTSITTTTEFFVKTKTRTLFATETITTCDRWHRNCGPKVVTKTKTNLYPTTVFCTQGHGCPRHRKPVQVTKTVVDLEYVTVRSVCTKVKTETHYKPAPVPCRRHPCPIKPEITTITEFLPTTIPYPCVVTKEVTVTKKSPKFCTFTETRLKFHERPQMQCHRKFCGPQTVTETLFETVMRPCVKKLTVPTTVTKPVIKPFPVKCTVTEVETLRETVVCRPEPCKPSTRTMYLTHTKVQPCVIKETSVLTKKVPVPIPVPKPFPVKCTVTEMETVTETVTCRRKSCTPSAVTKVLTRTKVQPCVITATATDVITKKVPVPRPYPVPCTYTITETSVRKVPISVPCTKYPCPRIQTSTVTDHHTRTVTKACKQKQTETLTKIKPVPVVIKEHEYITKTKAAPVTKTIGRICTVTETKTKLRKVPVKCTKQPCEIETLTEYIPIQVTRTCRDTATVTKPFPVRATCTVTETATKYRRVPVPCRQQPCPSETITEYYPITRTRPCVHRETETDYITTTRHHWKTRTKHTVCKVTETVTLTNTKILSTSTATQLVTVTKTRGCVVTETLPVPYAVPIPYPVSIQVPYPYPVPRPVICEKGDCPSISSSSSSDSSSSSSDEPSADNEPPGPHHSSSDDSTTDDSSSDGSESDAPQPDDIRPDKKRSFNEPPKNLVLLNDNSERDVNNGTASGPSEGCAGDQCPRSSVFVVQLRQCDANGVILGFDSSGLLRDQLNRIGYIADNFQFQFDLPVQAGGYGAKDFSAYKDPQTKDIYLTWRGSPDFYKCRSGSFENLYSQSIAPHCQVTRIMIFPCAVG